MTSMAGLNQSKRCMADLNAFDESMGWTFRSLVAATSDKGKPVLSSMCHTESRGDLDDEFAIIKGIENTRTAFDEVVSIPLDFVSPEATTDKAHNTSKAKSRTKKVKTAVNNRVYSKRATGPTASSRGVAVAHSADGESSNKSRYSDHGRTVHTQMPSCGKKSNQAVDFVYDVGVRRHLRQDMDEEHRELMRQNRERETRLRTTGQWIPEKAQPPSPKPGSTQRRRAWDHDDSRPSKTREPRDLKPPVKVTKSSISRNVSDWRTQQTAHHSSPEKQKRERKARADQKRAQQQYDAEEVEISIENFEQRIRSWAM